ncbi:UDP-N-acetylglucosamine--LPS N-acetylglucosamine transferase [Clostridium tetani]|uniref:MGDG synthase family glycosyltransferase n=1 Tax=Clostridium tetani TaxID=1513 RepID=UPI00100BCE15|nr:glycosyltransferase [Clostridium tetani]RXM77824.1 UDP-N-acetylglucosamine--LPS N-acetylglucosamine transferase [Clostridium tetani]RYU99521.1 UDP-N-acetylglucosamine--LPS N-acetylglucosamine transferase [Clostridium tetani]
MKVLIFSISAGGGHSKAAESLKEYIDLYSSKSTVKVIDTLKYINPIIDKVIIGSYLKTIKITPSLFGKLYDYTESDYGLSIISAKFNEIMTYRLLPLIKDFNPDILIATHPFPTEMLSILKSKHKINRPIISILTDYAPHSFWLHPCIDAYIVSNNYMISEMVSKGIPKNTIYPFGIPVSRDFLTNYSREETLSEINFYSDKPTILVMGGSLGIGKITKVYENLLKINENIQIIVIAGNNKKLYYELLSYRHSLDKDSTSYIIGFTDKVNKYMQASDLLLTKPGGLTITEALVSSIPLALFSPIPGQEEKNAEFLLTNNLAVDLGDGSNTKDIIENLLKDKSKLSNIKENQRKFSKPDVGKNIYNLILKLISDYKINIEEIYLNEKNPD